MRRRWAGYSARCVRLLAAEGMVSLGTLSLDGTKLARNAAQKADKTLPQIEKLLAEAAAGQHRRRRPAKRRDAAGGAAG